MVPDYQLPDVLTSLACFSFEEKLEVLSTFEMVERVRLVLSLMQRHISVRMGWVRKGCGVW